MPWTCPRFDRDPDTLGPQKNVTNRAYAFRGAINVVEAEIHFYDPQS